MYVQLSLFSSQRVCDQQIRAAREAHARRHARPFPSVAPDLSTEYIRKHRTAHYNRLRGDPRRPSRFPTLDELRRAPYTDPPKGGSPPPEGGHRALARAGRPAQRRRRGVSDAEGGAGPGKAEGRAAPKGRSPSWLDRIRTIKGARSEVL